MQNLPGASRVASMKSAKVHAEFCKQGLDTKQLWQSCVRSPSLHQKDTKTLFGRFPCIGLFPRMPNLVADLSAPLGPVEIEQLAAAYLRSVEGEDGGELVQPEAQAEAAHFSPAPAVPRSPLAGSLNWADEMDLEDAERKTEEKQQKELVAISTDICTLAGVVSIAAIGAHLTESVAAAESAAGAPRTNNRATRMALEKNAEPYSSQNPFDVLVGKKVARIEKQRAAVSATAAPPVATPKQDRPTRKSKSILEPRCDSAAAPVTAPNVAEPASRLVPEPSKPSPSASGKPKASGKIANMALQPSQSKYETYAAAALRSVARPRSDMAHVQPAAPASAPAPPTEEAESASSPTDPALAAGLNPFAPLWTPSYPGELEGYYYHDPYGAADAPAVPPEQEHLCLQDIYYSAVPPNYYCTHCPHCNPQGYPAYGDFEWQ